MADFTECIHGAVCDRCPNCKPDECEFFTPAADVVEVVRCKDCKHSVKYNCKNDACYSFTICRRRDGYSEGVEEDDFCSYGERKEATP